MSLVEKILPYERETFLWLNDLHTPFWDTFMWLYSGKLIWIPLVLVALATFVFKIKWQESLLLVLCMALVATLCDQSSSTFIKPFFERFRPTHHPDFRDFVNIVNNYRGGRFGFISSHAANGFGIIAFITLVIRNKWFTLTMILWGTITCYSRIYLGVHFISDIIGGIIVGTIMGVLVYYIYLWARYQILDVPKSKVRTSVISAERSYILVGTIAAIVVGIALFSLFFDLPTFKV